MPAVVEHFARVENAGARRVRRPAPRCLARGDRSRDKFGRLGTLHSAEAVNAMAGKTSDRRVAALVQISIDDPIVCPTPDAKAIRGTARQLRKNNSMCSALLRDRR